MADKGGRGRHHMAGHSTLDIQRSTTKERGERGSEDRISRISKGQSVIADHKIRVDEIGRIKKLGLFLADERMKVDAETERPRFPERERGQ
jgi:hypothetical protein